MNVNGDPAKRNIPPHLEPLFEAMLAGQTIPSITIIQGEVNKDDPSKDITLENVKAVDYWQGFGSGFDKELGKYVKHDFVDASPSSFYMGWVKSFTL